MRVAIGENRFDLQDLLAGAGDYDAMRERLLSATPSWAPHSSYSYS